MKKSGSSLNHKLFPSFLKNLLSWFPEALEKQNQVLEFPADLHPLGSYFSTPLFPAPTNICLRHTLALSANTCWRHQGCLFFLSPGNLWCPNASLSLLRIIINCSLIGAGCAAHRADAAVNTNECILGLAIEKKKKFLKQWAMVRASLARTLFKIIFSKQPVAVWRGHCTLQNTGECLQASRFQEKKITLIDVADHALWSLHYTESLKFL